MKSKAADKKKRVAYHEAGHTVARYLMFLPFAKVTIMPEGDALGYVTPILPKWFCRILDEYGDANKAVPRIEKEIISLFAGMVAEKKVIGRYNHPGAGSDRGVIIDYLFFLGENGELLKAHYKYLKLQAQGMLENPKNWKAIESVAGALMENNTLKSKEVKEIIKKSFS